MPAQVLDLIAAAARGRLVATQLDPPEAGGRQFRTALLNGFGQFFIVLLVIAGYQVYVLLESFLRPLAWALLTGTILFPFKTIMSTLCKVWIGKVKSTNTPLALALIKTPFKLLDRSMYYLGDIVMQSFRDHTTAILWGGIFFVVVSVLQSALSVIFADIDIISSLYATLKIFASVAASNWVWSILIAYALCLLCFWERRYKDRICALALPVHCAIGVHLIAQFGALSFPVVIFSGVVLGIGFLGELKFMMTSSKTDYDQEEINKNIAAWGPLAVLSPWNFTWWPALSRTRKHVASAHLMVTEEEPKEKPEKEVIQDKDLGSEANRYLKTLFKLCMIVQLWKNYQFVPLLIFPTVYSFLKEQIPQTKIYKFLVKKIQSAWNYVVSCVGDREEAIIPLPVVGLFRMAQFGDRRILNILESSVDETASNIMIFLMFVAVLGGSAIVAIEIQQETSYMVRMSGEFVNQTMTEHPEYLHWLPEGTQLQNQLQSGVDSIYVYVRQFVGDAVRSAIGNENITNTEHIANEVLTVMDRIYNAYLAQNATNQTEVLKTTKGTEEKSLGSIFDLLSWSFLMDYVYTNFETVYSVLNSASAIITENGALIASMATSILSFVVTYFSQFLDFILNAVFYLASLSFLLSLSGEDRYYPLEKLAKLTEYFPEAGNVATVVEQAISGIFNASFKMATFYAMYTYTLLSIFNVYVKFIPSIFAGIFAVIPIFPTYIVMAPSLIELFFIREDYFLGSLMAVGSYLPSTFVDEVMYREVKTAHPYMFGLSVAGGLMTMGIEGVVVGPIVLCAFVITIELSRMILKPDEVKK